MGGSPTRFRFLKRKVFIFERKNLRIFGFLFLLSKANSGHPGTPMAMAPVAYALWARRTRSVEMVFSCGFYVVLIGFCEVLQI